MAVDLKVEVGGTVTASPGALLWLLLGVWVGATSPGGSGSSSSSGRSEVVPGVMSGEVEEPMW